MHFISTVTPNDAFMISKWKQYAKQKCPQNKSSCIHCASRYMENIFFHLSFSLFRPAPREKEKQQNHYILSEWEQQKTMKNCTQSTNIHFNEEKSARHCVNNRRTQSKKRQSQHIGVVGALLLSFYSQTKRLKQYEWREWAKSSWESTTMIDSETHFIHHSTSSTSSTIFIHFDYRIRKTNAVECRSMTKIGCSQITISLIASGPIHIFNFNSFFFWFW